MDALHAIRALFDAEQRRDNRSPFARVIPTTHTVRYLFPPDNGAVLYSDLTPDNADAVIAAEIAWFRAQPGLHTLEWKAYDYDQPADLLARLAAHGFTIGEEEAVCVLDCTALPDRLRQPPTHDIRRIADLDGLSDVRAVEAAVWGADADWLQNGFIDDVLGAALREAPESIRIYCAYVDGMPVSAGWMDVEPGRMFAGLWGGSTVAEYRGRGIYTDLIAVRAQEAIRCGIRCLTIDASPMSRPIVERHGFRLLALSWPCTLTFAEAGP